jgi:hypothetical protein
MLTQIMIRGQGAGVGAKIEWNYSRGETLAVELGRYPFIFLGTARRIKSA